MLARRAARRSPGVRASRAASRSPRRRRSDRRAPQSGSVAAQRRAELLRDLRGRGAALRHDGAHAKSPAAWSAGSSVSAAKPPAPITATPIAPSGLRRDRRAARCARACARRLGVAQHERDARVGARLARPRRPRRASSSGCSAATRSLGIDAAARDEIEERLHVAVLGPAHEADRVVEAAFLVARRRSGRVRRSTRSSARLPCGRSRRARAPSRRRRRRPRVRAGGRRASPCLIGSLLAVPAQSSTASAPTPPVAPSTAASIVRGRRRRARDESARAAAPPARRGPRRGSTPITRHPARRGSATESWPTRPRPTTTTVSPTCGAARRTPCIAIDPTVAKLAVRSATPSGTRTTRLRGTATISAWCA